MLAAGDPVLRAARPRTRINPGLSAARPVIKPDGCLPRAHHHEAPCHVTLGLMTLTREQLYERIDNMSIDEPDLAITAADGGGFDVDESRPADFYVDDIGSLWEVPDDADEHGRRAFTAGPFTAYQYHASYVAPNQSNYDREIDDLAAGDVSAVIVGYGSVGEANTWVFGIRTLD